MHPRQTDRSLPVARSPRCWSTQPPLWVCLAFGVGLAATVSRRWIDIDGSFCADEGFFALAARNVMGGARPYRDFLFLQMPLLPYLYAEWFGIFGTAIETGRACSAVLTALATACIMVTVFRRAGPWAALCAGLLCSSSTHTTPDLTQIKTQAPCHFLIAAALMAIPRQTDGHRLARAALAMAFMSLAFLTRLTLVLPLGLLWLDGAWERRRATRREAGGYATIVAANVLLLAIVVTCFWANGTMWFGVYQSHHDVYGAKPWTWARLAHTAQDALGNQWILAIASAVAVARLWWCAAVETCDRDLRLPAFCLASYAAVTLAHWSQVLSYATHQTAITAFAVVFTSLAIGRDIDAVCRRNSRLACLAFVCAGAGLIAYHRSSWPAAGPRDAPGWLQEAVAIAGRHARAGDTLLSFDTELAVAGRFTLYPGCEMSWWGYFADAPAEVADRLHVLTMPRLLDAIGQRRADILAVTPGDFEVMAAGDMQAAQRIKAAIDKGYESAGVVDGYGQFAEPLFIYRRRERSQER